MAFKTRFIYTGKSWHVDPGGDPRHRKRASDVGDCQATGLRQGARVDSDTTQFKRAIDMTDDELAAIVARAKLTVV